MMMTDDELEGNLDNQPLTPRLSICNGASELACAVHGTSYFDGVQPCDEVFGRCRTG